jgi:hypothetical protein
MPQTRRDRHLVMLETRLTGLLDDLGPFCRSRFGRHRPPRHRQHLAPGRLMKRRLFLSHNTCEARDEQRGERPADQLKHQGGRRNHLAPIRPQLTPLPPSRVH